MLCEHLGIAEKFCVHRSRYQCIPQLPPPAAIVIANTVNRTKQDYYDELARPGTDRCIALPFSADYVVGRDGNIDQLIPIENCMSLPLCGNDLNRYIVIVLEGDLSFTKEQLRSAARLACCLAKHFGIVDQNNVPIVKPIYQLDSTKPLRKIPSDFFAYLSACYSGDIPEETPAPQPSCCDELRSDLARLNDSLAQLRRRLEALEAKPDPLPLINQVEARVISLEGRVGMLESSHQALQAQVATMSARIARLERCFERLPQCNETPPPCEIVYRISERLQLTPMVNHIINFAQRVQDQDPPLVTTGPLWQAMLSDGGPSRTWTVTGEIQIEAREWCVNKGVRIYVQDCSGNAVLVAQWIAPSGGPHPPVTLNWSYPVTTISGQACYSRVLVHVDDTTVPFFYVSGGFVRMSL